MMDKLREQIKRIHTFDEEDINLFVGFLNELTIKKGEYFLKEGQVSHYVAYLIEGLTMHYKLHEGVEIPCDFTKENEWLGYLKSFTNRTPSDMNIKTLEDTKLLVLSADNLRKLFELQPKFMLLKNYFTEQSFISNTQHSADLVMLSAKQRYHKFMQEKPDLLNRIPQYYIAAYLGMKPQSLSRIRK